MEISKIEKVILSIIAIVLFSAFQPQSIFADSQPNMSGKIIFLTFDADMNPAMKKESDSGVVKQWYDPALVKYLEDNNISATFFVTGMFAEAYPNLIKELANNSNFSIQNHSYSHPAFKPNCYNLPLITTDQEKKTEIEKAQSSIKTLTGKVPKYFRYPGLCHTIQDDAIVAKEKLWIISGEFPSGDAFMKSTKNIVKNVLDNIQDHHVIVFHLGSKLTPKTTKAVEKLIPQLKSLGYTFQHF